MIEALRTMCAVESDGKGRLALTFTVACGVAISSGILASMIYLLLALLSMVGPAFAESTPVGAEAPLLSGNKKEGCEGDLKAAILFRWQLVSR